VNSESTQEALIGRLKQLMGNEKPYPWAKRIGLSQATFDRIWKKGVFPKGDTLLLISEKADCSIDWLVAGRGPMKRAEGGAGLDLEEYALVPRYNVEVSAGGGAIVEGEAVIGTMAFRREWLKRMGLELPKLAIVTVQGDSMEPTLIEGDVVLIDLRKTDIIDGAIHVLRNDGQPIIKRLQLGLADQVIIRSDNKIYSALETTRDKLNVVGRVVWRGGRM
jgi:phage repressor protein C with HTH and peptisase S24 domain